jgi:predicted HicB family RNase H-like nuclease
MKQQVMVRMDEKTRKQLETAAKADQRSLSSMIRIILDLWLKTRK